MKPAGGLHIRADLQQASGGAWLEIRQMFQVARWSLPTVSLRQFWYTTARLCHRRHQQPIATVSGLELEEAIGSRAFVNCQPADAADNFVRRYISCSCVAKNGNHYSRTYGCRLFESRSTAQIWRILILYYAVLWRRFVR